MEVQLQAVQTLNPILLYSSCTLNIFQQTKTYHLHIHTSISSIYLSCFIWYLIIQHFSLPLARSVRTLELFVPFILFVTSYSFNTFYWNSQLRLYSQRYNSCRSNYLRFLWLIYSLLKMEITTYEEFDLICSVWLGLNFVSQIFCIYRTVHRHQ